VGYREKERERELRPLICSLFQVAMRREKFPETVPFRLTRMLVNAMEVRS